MTIYTLIFTAVPSDFISVEVMAASTSYEEMLNRLKIEAKNFFNDVVKRSPAYDDADIDFQWDDFYTETEDDATWEIYSFGFYVQFHIITSEIN